MTNQTTTTVQTSVSEPVFLRTNSNTEKISSYQAQCIPADLARFLFSKLIAGLTDIQAKVKKERKELIEPVIVCAQACLDSFDCEPDHDEAWARYEMWVES